MLRNQWPDKIGMGGRFTPESVAGMGRNTHSGLTNGSVEGINSMIQAAKARARGYSTKHNLILMTYLITGKLAHLPRSPFKPTTTSCGQGVAA